MTERTALQLRCVIALCSCLHTFLATTSVCKAASEVTSILLSFVFDAWTVFLFLGEVIETHPCPELHPHSPDFYQTVTRTKLDLVTRTSSMFTK